MVEWLNKVSLKEAEEKLRYHRKYTNPNVNYLLKEVSIVGHRYLFLNKSKINARYKLKAFILRYGLLVIWFIINLNDLINLIYIKLIVYRKYNIPIAREILDKLMSNLR